MSLLTERRLEEKERRRNEILDAAEAVASIVGIETMTMDQVAKKARLSRALLYVYFGDKSDLLTAICTRALEVLEARFSAAVASRHLGVDKVEACGRSYVAFAAEFPVRFEALALFEAQLPGIEEDPEYTACLRAGDALQCTLVAAIEAGQRDGSIRADAGAPGLIGFTLWGLMHGLIQIGSHKSGHLQRHGISPKDLIENGFRLALQGLSPAEPSR
jgi:AcrR family transcriptional regulator